MSIARKIFLSLLTLMGAVAFPSLAQADQYMVSLKDASPLSLQAVSTQSVDGIKDLGQIGIASNRLIDIPHNNVASILSQLKSSAAVQYVEPNFKIKGLGLPNDPFVQDGSQWWFTNIQASPAWDAAGNGSAITVAVVDSGLMSSHEDLSGRLWTNPTEIPGNGLDDDGNGKIDDVNGWNWVDGNADIADQSGHGTRVAGIIAANSNNSLGIAGVSPQAKIMPLRFLDANNEGKMSDAIAALDYARLKGAKIVNNSWGYYTVSDPESKLYRDALDRARTAGMLVVNAAGNDGYNLDTKAYYPASYPQDNNLVVSSIDSKDPWLPTWANYGIKTVDVLAPGVNIKSSDQTGNYSLADGTSLSAPMVAGAAAWLWGQRPSATYLTIRSALSDHAVNISSLSSKTYKGAKLDLASSWNWLKTAPVLPVNLTAPVASSDGSNLSCTAGTWQAGFIARYYFAWYLSSAPTVSIGAAPLMKIRDGMWGKNALCKVTVKNTMGSTTTASVAITTPRPAPANITPPSISGLLGVSRSLTCAPGKWIKDPANFSYSWTLAGNPVDGNNTNLYTINQSDYGKVLSCTVKGSNNSLADPPVLQEASSTSRPVLVTWRADNLAPAAPLVVQPKTPTTLTKIPIAVKGEVNALFQCKIDGGAALPCGAQTDVLPEGTHTLQVTQLDLAGNKSPVANVSWTVDLTAPAAPDMDAVFQPGTPPVTTGSASITNSQSISVTFKAFETGATFQCKFDEEVYKPCVSPYSRIKLTSRKHTLLLKQFDAAGNLSEAKTMEWTIDREAPAQPTFNHMPATSSPLATDYISFSGDGTSTFECAYDSALESSYQSCVSPYDLKDMTIGNHSLNVRQVDAAKNKSVVKTYSWTVTNPDIFAPAPPTIITTPSGVTNSTSVQATWTGELGAKSECLVDNSIAGYKECSSPLSLSGLSEGTHSLKIRQTDASSNVGDPAEATWTIDLTAPAAPVLSGAPAAYKNANSATTINFASLENSPTFSYSLNGGVSWSAYSATASYTFTSQVNGNTYKIKVRQKDQAGNTSADSAEQSWIIDTGAPAVPNITQLTTPTKNTSAAITFVAAEAGGTVQCKLDAGDWGNCDSYNTTSKAGAWALTSLAEGSHTVSVRQTDAAGNAGAADTMTWVVDLTAPAAPSIAQLTTPTKNTASTLTFTAAETGGTVQCKLDAGDWGNCTSFVAASKAGTWALTGLTEGSHTVSVRQTDAALNTGTDDTMTWTVDLTAPDAPSIDQLTTPTKNTATTISFAAAEVGGSVQCKLDAGAWGSCTGFDSSSKAGTWALTGLAAGSHTVSIRQTDTSGNVGSAGTMTWVVDLTAPIAPSIAQLITPTKNIASTLTFTAAETGGSVQCKLDAGDWGNCTSYDASSRAGTWSLAELTEGSHTVSVRQTDAALNTGTGGVMTWVVDLTAPAAPSIAQLTTPTKNTASTLTFTAAETGGTVQCKLDAGDWGNCTSFVAASKAGTWALTGLTEGSHTVSVRQTDAAGNVGPSDTMDWVVDLTAPDAPSIAQLTTPTKNTATTISFTAAEVGGSVQCKLDAGTWGSCTGFDSSSKAGALNLASLAAGSHTVSVRQTDTSGNVGSAGTMTWVVDLTAPATPSIDQLVTPTNSTSAAVTFTAAETSGTVQCKIDAGVWVDCDSYDGTTKAGSLSLLNLAEGSHTVSARQTDAAGNTGAAGTMTWVIDLTAPSAPSVTQLTTPTNSTSSAVIFTAAETGGSVQCKLDSGAWAGCTSFNTTSKAGTFSLTGLTEGSHTVSVRQTDSSGNVGSVGTMTWTVDLTAPDTPTLSGAPAAYKNNTTAVTISFNSSETSPVFSYSINGGTTWSAYSSTASYTFSSQANGTTYRIKVRQKDQALNISNDSSEVSWTVDTSAPSAPSVAQLVTPTLSTSASISFTAAEASGSVQCKLDAGVWGDCDTYDSSNKSGAWALTALAEGSHTVSVRQTDTAGNVGAVGTMTWVVDLTAPSAPSVTQLVTPTLSTSASVVFTAAETGGSVQCKLDTGAWVNNCTSFNTTSKAGTFSLTGLAEGSHTVSVRQADSSGNVGSVGTMTWTVDLTAPDTPTLSGAPAAFTNSTSAVTVTVSNPEANATLSYSVNSGSTWSAYSSTPSYTFSSQANGSSYKIRWRQKDQAGNVSSSSADASWTVDTTAPVAPSLTGTPSTYTSSSSASISITGETSATFTCSVDGGDYSACTSPKSLTGLADGLHSLAVKQVDQAGNTSTTATTASWTVDTTAPSAPSLTGFSGSTQNTAGTAAWTGEASAQFAYSTDGGATWSAWSSTASKAYSAMTAGSYSLQVKQKDQAGNESTPASLSWTVQAPTLTSFTATTAGGTGIAEGSLLSSDTTDSQSVKFSIGTAATPITSTECQIDSGSWTACTAGTAVSSSLATGTQHTLNVRISTSAGTSTASFVNWKIMPTLTFDNTRGISTGTSNGTSTFNIEDPKDTTVSNPTSYQVYYTSNADSNITGTTTYKCERYIGYISVGSNSTCSSGTSFSTGVLTYSADGSNDMTVYVQANIGGALTNRLAQRIHAYAPYPNLSVTNATVDSYSQMSTGFSYSITNGTAKTCQWKKYDTNGSLTGTVNFSYGCPNSGAGGSQTVVTNGYFPECATCWDATDKGASMYITAQSADARLTYSGETSPRWRRNNSYEFLRLIGSTTDYPINLSADQCYNSGGRAAGSATSTMKSTFMSSGLLMNTACPSGTYHSLYYGSVYFSLYNWGDDVTFQAKLNSTYSSSSGASAMARLSTSDGYSSALIDMPYKTEMPATAVQSSSAFKTCKMPQNESTIGSSLYLYIYARNASGNGGAYFKAFSSSGSRTGTAASPLAGSCV